MESCSVALGLEVRGFFLFSHTGQSCEHYSELPMVPFPAPLLSILLWPGYLLDQPLVHVKRVVSDSHFVSLFFCEDLNVY